MKLFHILCFVLILVVCNLHEVADGQGLANSTGTSVSANANGTKVSANVSTTKTPDGPALTNSTGSQASKNANGTTVSSTQKPAGTLLVEGGSWNSGKYKKPQWPWKDLHFVVTIKEPETQDPLHDKIKFVSETWAFSTCIEFIFTKDEKTDLVFKREPECSIDYGTPGTPSVIHVNDSCISTRHLHHVLGHYLGLFDEQRRPDRDEYIEILQTDLPPATQRLLSKFDSSEVNLYSTMYDLSSVMHMSPRSMDDGGKAIFRTKNPKFHGIPGRVVHPSHWDLYRVNVIHGCQERFLERCEVPPNSCKNGGLLTHFCVCECPAGTNGTHCEQVTGHYYEDEESTCSQVITKNLTTLVAGNFVVSSKKSWCLFQVKAPEHNHIVIAFDFTEPTETSKSTRCHGSLVSITEVSLQEVEEIVICGEDFRKLQIYLSKTNEVDIFYDVRDNERSRGFKATITFHNQDNSTVSSTESTTIPVPTTTVYYDDFITTTGDYDDDLTTLPSPIKERTSAVVSTTGKTTKAHAHAHTEASLRTKPTPGSVAGLPVRAACNRDVFLCAVQYVMYSLFCIHLFHL